MPSIAGKIAERRIIVPVALIVPRPGADAYGSVASPFNIDIHRTLGLIDTGAQSTCITRAAVQRYGLRTVGKKLMGNVHSDEMHQTFAFRIAFYLPGAPDSPERLWHVDRDLTGAEIKPHPAFELLIGMDIIGLGDLSLKRSGDFTFAMP